MAQTDLNLHLIMAGPDGDAWQAELERLTGALGIAVAEALACGLPVLI